MLRLHDCATIAQQCYVLKSIKNKPCPAQSRKNHFLFYQSRSQKEVERISKLGFENLLFTKVGFWKIWGLEAAAADAETDTCIRPETPEQRRGNEYPILLLHAIQSRTTGETQQEPGARELTDTVCKIQSPENRADQLRIAQEEEMYYGNK